MARWLTHYGPKPRQLDEHTAPQTRADTGYSSVRSSPNTCSGRSRATFLSFLPSYVNGSPGSKPGGARKADSEKYGEKLRSKAVKGGRKGGSHD